jgi:protocatechuate 3,4-dioxygenase beta subunit
MVCPEPVQGPDILDEDLSRSDLRHASDGSLSRGVPLLLVMRLQRVTARAHMRRSGRLGSRTRSLTVVVVKRGRPLPAALVEIAHCDALGVPSAVRGYQISDEQGIVAFQTIYPGACEGRAVHIDFRIRTNPAADYGFEVRSQLFFPDSLNDEILTVPPYSTAARRRTRNNQDPLFRTQDGRSMTLQPIRRGRGCVATFEIDLELA